MLVPLDKLQSILIKRLVILGNTLITNYYNLILLLANLMIKSTEIDIGFLIE